MNRYGIIFLSTATLALLAGCAAYDEVRDPLFHRAGYGSAVTYEVNSPGWSAACARRYPGFDEDSGTYRGEDGGRYYCIL
jgi:hypothetical protein